MKSPSEEGGNGIAPDYTNRGQMAAHREKTRKEKQRGTVERAIIQAFRKGIPRRKTERERVKETGGGERKCGWVTNLIKCAGAVEEPL